jgi:beta-fructofuranosidase
LVALACDDSSNGGSSLQCGADVPIQLTSKLDDDDGDGNPLDEAFPLIDDEDDDIADHTWILDHAGVYHLFFQSESLYHPTQIEHYTTIDFQHLDYVGTALTVNPGAWDGDALWAPHIVEHDGSYYMFYTGVAGEGPDAVQRIGLATSRDLTTWTRASINRCTGTTGDGCIYECDEPWTTWGGTSGSYNQQCRDPFVMWDGDAQRWLLFTTARHTNAAGVVTVASASELTTWAGAGYLDATRRIASGVEAQTTGGQCENPFVVATGGAYYLIFTDWEDAEDSVTVANPRTIAQYARSESLAIDATGSTNWIYHGYLPDPGVNAIEVIELERAPGWLMSQSISNRHSGVPRLHRRELRLKCVTFGEDGEIDTANWGRVSNESRVTGVGLESHE